MSAGQGSRGGSCFQEPTRAPTTAYRCEQDPRTFGHAPAVLAGSVGTRRYGGLAMSGRKGLTLEERFWSRVEKTATCWNWTGGRTSNGYGTIRKGGRSERVSRVIWEWFNGPIPAGMLVCHHCDNRVCVNLEHLFLGTHKDNAMDMMKKGRHVPALGDRNGTHTHPECRPFGDRNGTRVHPETRPFGEKNGSHRHPEMWANAYHNLSHFMEQRRLVAVGGAADATR